MASLQDVASCGSLSEVPPSTQPRREGRRFRRWEVIAPIVVALFGALLAFERLPKNTRRTLWAEDGPLFLGDALLGNYNVFAVYAGYLHVMSRAAALLVVHTVEVRAFALGINVSACLITGLVAAVVYIGSEDVVSQVAARIWLALTTVLVPLVGVEVVANLANLHSILMWGCFWGLLRHPRTLGGAIALATFELFGALSEVQTLFLVPLALCSLWLHRSVRQLLVTAGCCLGAAGQLLAALTHERGGHPHLLDLSVVTQLLGLEVAMPLWVLGDGEVRHLIAVHGWGLAALSGLPLIIGLVLALWFGDRLQRFAALAAWGLGLLIFCMSHMLNTAVMGGGDYSVLEQAPVLLRYAVVPSLLFVSTLAVGASAAWRAHRAAGSLAAASVLVLLAAAVANFRSPQNVRHPATSWTRQMAEARAACTPPTSVEYPFRISPYPWVVGVPCSLIR